jgi:hypothetical protein
MIHNYENKALIPRVLDRASMSRDAWRHFVTDSLRKSGTEMEQLASGAWKLTRGHAHLTTSDLSTLRGRELEQFVG